MIRRKFLNVLWQVVVVLIIQIASQGTFCEVDLSACEESLQCQNNGTCVADSRNTTGTGFMCSCLSGFVGEQCEIDISVCNSTENVCQNGGKCVDGPGDRFFCECLSGWYGETCDLDIDECESSPCMAGGICVNKINDFSCACPFGFTGRTCETKLRICEENPCLNGAFCLHESEDDESEKTCYCVPDYHGTLCEFRYNDCDPPPKCFNGGTCIDGVGEFSCSCPPNFFGPTCQCTAYNVSEPECSPFYPNGTTLPFESITATIPYLTTAMVTFMSDIFMSTPTALYHPPTVQVTPSVETIDIPLPGETFSVGPGVTDYYKTPYKLPSSSVFMESEGGTGRDDLETKFPSDAFPPIQPTVVLTDTIDYSPTLAQTLTSVLMSLLPPPSLITPGETLVIYESSKTVGLDGSEDFVHPPPSTLGGPTDDFFTLHATATPAIFSSDGRVDTTPVITSDLESVISLIDPHLGGDGVVPTVDLTADYGRTPSVSDIEHGEQTEPTVTFIPSPTLVDTASPILSEFIDEENSKDLPVSPHTVTELEMTAAPTPTRAIAYPPAESQSIYNATQSIIIIDSMEVGVSSIPPEVSMTTTDHLILPEATVSFSLDSKLSAAALPPPQSGISGGLDLASSTVPPHLLHPSTTVSPPFEGDYDTMTMVIVSSQLPFPITPEPLPIPDTGSETGLSPSTPPLPTTTSFTTPSPSQKNETDVDPCFNHCYNDAECYSNSIEPICICSFRFTGLRCEIPREKFSSASFTGNSFLSYRVPNDSSISKVHVRSKLVTIVPEGILLYTGAGRMYALIFIQSGHVTLHFSCGSQSMHFVETRTRVDNGFNFTLDFRMEMIIQGVNLFRCSAEVSVNQSYVMKGEQVVGKEGVAFPAERPIEKVYLGGVPPLNTDAVKNDNLVGILPGFRGCLHNLLINQEQRDVYDDALDGKEVDGCRSFSCVANPCHGSARCLTTHVYPFWECLCSPGFTGHRCQLIVCSSNPCQNGASCTYSEESLELLQANSNLTDAGPDPNSHGVTTPTTAISLREQPKPICLCPLGFSGALCQLKINITKPAFYPIAGYSAYLSYDQIPRFSDWFQLKFHFVTKNISQISILLYTGNERGAKPIKSLPRSQFHQNQSLSSVHPLGSSFQDFHPDPISDFFAITFLHGFIALTWNLGSGTQRITTPSRIDNRLNIHTLFAGRSGRQAWLKVDGMRNVTGKSPGPLYRLNANPNELYIGGYKSYKFEGLAHDLPLHQGFQGCIFDLGFRVKNRLYLPRPIKGRNVKNCFEEIC